MTRKIELCFVGGGPFFLGFSKQMQHFASGELVGVRYNEISDKILIICEVLGVSPYELLSGAEHTGSRSREHDTYVISKGTDVGTLVESYQELDPDLQKRLLGYLEALKELR